MIQRPITGKDEKAGERDSFFHVILVSFIWHRVLSNPTQMVFHWLSNVQFVAVLLFIQLENLTAKPQDLLSMFLHKFCKIIGSIDLLNLSSENFAILSIVGIWLYSLALVSTVLLITIKFMLKKGLTQGNQKFLTLVSQFHLNIGFGFSVAILYQFICQEDHQIIKSEIFQETFFRVTHILLMIANYVMGLLFALLSFNVIPSEDLLVVRNPISQVLLFLLKALAIPIVASHTQSDFLIWILILFSLIILLVRYYHILDTFHYLHYLTMNVSMDFSLIGVIICIANIVAKIKLNTGKPIQALSTTYIQILLIALALKLSKANINRILESALKSDGGAIKTETDMIKRLFGLSRLVREAKTPIDDLNKRSLHELHLKCILSSDSTNNSEFRESEIATKGYSKQIASVLSSMFIQALGSIRLSSNVKLVFSYFLISQNRNLPKAITYLLEASNSKNFNYIMATHLMTLLKQRFEEERKYEKHLDLGSFLDFEARAIQFTENIHSNSGRYIDFWKTYNTTRFEMMDLFSKSKEIENIDIEIKKSWEKGTKKYPEFANSLINIYSVYLRLIRNAPFTAFKLEKQFCFSQYLWRDRTSDIEGSLEQKNLEAPNNIVVDISLNKKSFGKIIYITPNVADYLGWAQKDLIGRNINTLMLPTSRERFSYQEVDDDSGQSAIFKLKQKIETFVQTKQGYARGVTCYTDIHPHLSGELVYIMILRVKISDEQSIIINTLGEVEGITSDLASYLRMPNSQQRISISDFCSNAIDLNLINGAKNIEQSASTAKSLAETKKSLEAPEKVEFELFQWTKDGTKVSSHVKTFKAVIRSLPIAKTFVKIVSFDIKRDLITGTLVNYDACYSVNIEKDQRNYEIEDEDSANFQTPPELTSQGPEKFRLTTTGGDMKTNNFLDTLFTTAVNSPLVSPSHSERKNFVKKVKVTRHSTGDQFEEKEEEDQKKEDFLGATELDADIVASSSNGLVNAQNRMEKAIYLFPQGRRRNILRILALLYCATCSALLIGFEIKYKDTNNTLAANTIIMSNSTRRLEKLLEVNMFAFRILAITNEFAPKTNFGLYGELQYRTLSREWIKKVAGDVKIYNQALRESVYKINSDFQKRFFDKITVVEREDSQPLYSTRGMNSFDLMDEIIAAVDGYYGSASVNNLNEKSTDLQFILDNSRSNILASGETITNIVLEDNEVKMNDTFLLLKMFTVVAGVFAILMLVFLIAYVQRFRKNRDRFINIFLRIHDPNIRDNMFKAQVFRERLQRCNMDGRKAKIIASESDTRNNIVEISVTQSFRRRDVKQTSLNKKLIRLVVLAVLVNLILFSGFIWALPVVHSHNENTKATIERIVESDTASFQSVFLVTQTFNFILQNGAGKMRGLPVAEQYDLTLDVLGDMQNRFIDLAQELANKDENSKIYALLKGNECDLITALISLAGDNCKTSLGGVLEKGLLQASNYFVSTLKNVKEIFENSPRAYSDVSAALNNNEFVGIEPFLFSYWIYAYGDISDLFRKKLMTDANEFSEKVGVLMIVWGVINIIFGALGWFKIESIFQREEEDWRKVIRNVPINTIWRNKMLKSYLFKNKQSEL